MEAALNPVHMKVHRLNVTIVHVRDRLSTMMMTTKLTMMTARLLLSVLEGVTTWMTNATMGHSVLERHLDLKHEQDQTLGGPRIDRVNEWWGLRTRMTTTRRTMTTTTMMIMMTTMMLMMMMFDSGPKRWHGASRADLWTHSAGKQRNGPPPRQTDVELDLLWWSSQQPSDQADKLFLISVLSSKRSQLVHNANNNDVLWVCLPGLHLNSRLAWRWRAEAVAAGLRLRVTVNAGEVRGPVGGMIRHEACEQVNEHTMMMTMMMMMTMRKKLLVVVRVVVRWWCLQSYETNTGHMQTRAWHRVPAIVMYLPLNVMMMMMMMRRRRRREKQGTDAGMFAS
jgi:hypothetical protein